MGNGVSISRGNPRSSSVGEDQDIEEVRHRSTHALDPSLVTEIVPCGEGVGDPCSDVDLSIYNVMGQEDRFRQINGVRADRGGTARIVLTAEEDVTIEKIDYVSQPTDEDNPTFDSVWNPDPDPNDKHEIFVSVDPDSLYAFQITIGKENCPDTNTSGIYYLQTGNEIIIPPGGNLSTSISVKIISTSPISVESDTEVINGPTEVNGTSRLIYGFSTSIGSKRSIIDQSFGVDNPPQRFVTLTSSQVV